MTEDMPTTNDGDDLELADPNDWFVRRKDGDSRPEPVKQRIPGTDKAILVRPPLNGHLEKWDTSLTSDDPDPEDLAEMFNVCLPQLDFEVTPEMIEGDLDGHEGMIGYGVMPLREAIKHAAGFRAFLGYRESQAEQVRVARGMVESLGLDEEAENDNSDDTKPPLSESTS
ncbi:hypothetical protein C5C07_15395 [Haloferax sp. Atlit-4N]|uniref:hypothetical protein n=1 Tax=unclassified Haloferax TaxID=2625095 RepID=UPI0005B2349B|nr:MULTISPECIES: hypothetical protein [unclassified Haloferax]RDZ53118.1 hypothetical protein C5C07_15395 [Haloferax sp. Atlit-4N]